MGWKCQLYGHQWRHPGTYEVVIADGSVPAYPFQCAVCESEMLMDTTGTPLSDDWEPESVGTEPELEPEEPLSPSAESADE